MSMSLIIATPHEIYISCDTALSHVGVDGKVYRLSLQGKPLPIDKVYPIDGATLFISGDSSECRGAADFMRQNPKASNEEIIAYLDKNTHRQENMINGKSLCLVICSVIDGQSLVRVFEVAFDRSEKVKYTEYAPQGEGHVLAAGFATDDVRDMAVQLINEQRYHIDDIYRQVYKAFACNGIGGSFSLYTVSNQNAFIYREPIPESGIEYFDLQDICQLKTHHINANSVASAVVETGLLITNRIQSRTDPSTFLTLHSGNHSDLTWNVRGTPIFEITDLASGDLSFASRGGTFMTVSGNGVSFGNLSVGGQTVATEQWVENAIQNALDNFVPAPAP